MFHQIYFKLTWGQWATNIFRIYQNGNIKYIWEIYIYIYIWCPLVPMLILKYISYCQLKYIRNIFIFFVWDICKYCTFFCCFKSSKNTPVQNRIGSTHFIIYNVYTQLYPLQRIQFNIRSKSSSLVHVFYYLIKILFYRFISVRDGVYPRGI